MLQYSDDWIFKRWTIFAPSFNGFPGSVFSPPVAPCWIALCSTTSRLPESGDKWKRKRRASLLVDWLNYFNEVFILFGRLLIGPGLRNRHSMTCDNVIIKRAQLHLGRQESRSVRVEREWKRRSSWANIIPYTVAYSSFPHAGWLL